MFPRISLLIVFSLFLLTGCKSKQRTVSTSKKSKKERVIIDSSPNIDSPSEEDNSPLVIVEAKANATYEEVVAAYINNYGQIAKEEMLQYGIPASITLAQGILESGAGRGTLSKRANNHFGIKCHKGWTGERVYHDDDRSQECFRKYKNSKYSFRDHSLFLTQRSRYAGLFELKKDDYRGWAKGLKKAGYATDPKYPDKLISIIERYNLAVFDQVVLGKKSKRKQPDVAKINTYTIKKGDTLYSIARRFSMDVETLKAYNGLQTNDIAIGQVLNLQGTKN